MFQKGHQSAGLVRSVMQREARKELWKCRRRNWELRNQSKYWGVQTCFYLNQQGLCLWVQWSWTFTQALLLPGEGIAERFHYPNKQGDPVSSIYFKLEANVQIIKRLFLTLVIMICDSCFSQFNQVAFKSVNRLLTDCWSMLGLPTCFKRTFYRPAFALILKVC